MANHFCRNIFSRFLHSSSTSSSSYTVDFLVNSCGLPFKSAVSVSTKFQLNERTPQNPKLVLQFLKSHHFSDTLLARLILKRPQVLNCRIHDNLKPKFDYLVEIGFGGELLPHLILSNPYIAKASLASTIKPNVDFLRLFLDSHDKFLKAVKGAPWLLSENSKAQLQQKFDLLMKEEALPAHVVQRLLTLSPRSIFQSPPEILIRAVSFLKDLGFQPTDAAKFIHAFRVKIQMTDTTWNNKIELMKSLGFCQEDILNAFKRFPHFLGLSEDNIRKSLKFYFNTMRLEPQTIILNPALLGYSIENRCRPRYHVLKVLESKKLIKGNKNLKVLQIGEKNFQEEYIDKFIDEVPGLLEFYVGMKEAKGLVLDGEEVSFPLQLK
ncbi:Mitochondrial transcription termination factor family protein [Euphorbia peplus]|nr:Mitochondrial transcription termination factor family protein [Euphorbia peplus]